MIQRVVIPGTRRYGERFAGWWMAVSVALSAVAVCAFSFCARAEGRGPLRVDLELRSGGALSGEVIDHSSHGVVIVADDKPYVFSWNAIKAESACRARLACVVDKKGSLAALDAADHFELGSFALARRRPNIAAGEFREAERLDAGYKPRVLEAYRVYRESKRKRAIEAEPFAKRGDAQGPAGGDASENLQETVHGIVEQGLNGDDGDPAPYPASSQGTTIEPLDDSVRAKVAAAYRAFGRQVQESLAVKLTLVETDHFLIWTDWESVARPKLAEWAEAMYAALCDEFHLDRSGDVFLAKCPMFCFQTRNRLRRFAQRFDGYSGEEAIGYTRSVPQSGHVHIVLARQGRSSFAYDQFACNLVHEGTHAFLHRLHSSRVIPHWVNEGYAELIAARVLGERCPSAADAQLLAKQYVQYGWTISGFLADTGPVAVHQYPLAHSVVAYMVSLGRKRWIEFILELKRGTDLADALARQYDGLTMDELESRWRAFQRADGR